MNPLSGDPGSEPGDAVEVAAVKWLARRDRGLSAAEQDAYLQWLQENPAHGAEIARLANAWGRLDCLRQWHPTHSDRPNPDLLRPTTRRSWLRPALWLAAAAAVVLIAGLNWPAPIPGPGETAGVIVHPGPRRLALPDGSIVELNTGASVEVQFSPERRDVRLVHGEAHFIVAKNAARPFIVSAGAYAVRAVGTAFDVRLAEPGISVLVTEGHVQLAPGGAAAAAVSPHQLGAGQLGTVAGIENFSVAVQELSPAQIESALDWQSLRLEFKALPLSQIVAEFNRYNSRQLVIEDPTVAAVVIGGTFRADNVEAFVRLLDVGFGIRAQARGDDLVLQRAE